MSRSRRKPWFVDGYGTKWKKFMKNYANRVVRHTENIPDGMAYKRCFSQYDICDWRHMYDPWPYVYTNWRTGELEWLDPDPRWKAVRK